MPEMEITVEFSAYCSTCGAGICRNVSVEKDRHGNPTITVEPCEKCLKEKYDEGFKDGETTERENNS
jgi:hypothetical protein